MRFKCYYLIRFVVSKRFLFTDPLEEMSENGTPLFEQNEGTTSDYNCRSFSVDFIVVTVKHRGENKETLALLVKENIPWGTEFRFHANFNTSDLTHGTFVLVSIRLTNQKKLRAVLGNVKTKETKLKLVISSYKDQLRHA